jgi:hypothetical protein
MEYSTKTTLPLNSNGIFYPLSLLPQTLSGITLHSYLFTIWKKVLDPQKGRKMQKGTQSLRFWRLMPKGEKVLSPKQRTAPPFQKISKWSLIGIFSIGIYFNWYILKLVSGINWDLCFTWFIKVKFQFGTYLKTLLKAKRRISFRGSFI